MNKQETLAKKIYDILVEKGEPMTLQGISDEIQEKPMSTIRGRIYDNLGKLFRKIARGVYWVEGEDVACVVLEADSRKGLSLIDSSSVDALICDHPWESKSNKGGNRNFTSDYDCFCYTQEDFEEKARVLKDGHFLVEILPEENADNYEYLYQIKKMAEKAGLFYYAKVPWRKGNKINNVGRKSKNTEDVCFFSKGKPRHLRPDKKKIFQGQKDAKMSGTAYMLPTEYNFQPPSNNERIHQSEKPVGLYEQILEAITIPGEICLDSFSGSGVLGAAALRTGRFSVLFEILRENVEKISNRLGATAIYKEHLMDERKRTDVADTNPFVQLALF